MSLRLKKSERTLMKGRGDGNEIENDTTTFIFRKSHEG